MQQLFYGAEIPTFTFGGKLGFLDYILKNIVIVSSNPVKHLAKKRKKKKRDYNRTASEKKSK